MTEYTKSVFRKVIEKRDSRGVVSKQTILDVTPWEFGNSKGYTCRITVQKYGNVPKTTATNIDPSDPEVKKSFLDMFQEVEKINK